MSDLRALLAEALNDARVPDALVTKQHEETVLDVLMEYLAVNNQPRPDMDTYALGLARSVSVRGECLRSRVGAVLVQNERVIATGYNGVGPGQPSCLDGACPRGTSGVPRKSEGGPGYDEVPCIAELRHAEDNAITDALQRGLDPRGATIYLTKEPCFRCRVLLDGLDLRVVWWDETRQMGHRDPL